MPWEPWIKAENCPGPCSGCEEGDHHWLELCLDPENEDDVGHPALPADAVEAVMVWGCKHCDAWKLMTDEDLEELEDELPTREMEEQNHPERREEE